MTDSEEIAALRQEVENWKLIAVEQGRRTDLMNKRLNNYINREHMPPPPTEDEIDLCIVKEAAKRLERRVDCIWDVLTWLDARLVAIEKQPGIVPKNGWIEGRAINNQILVDDILIRMTAAMHRIEPS